MLFGTLLYPKITFAIKKRKLDKIDKLPKITILIPAYNEEKTIEGKIKNTLSIDYPKKRFKVVVIDNESTDNTYKIAKKFPITVLKSKRGKINALNKGLDYAKTEIIVMTDADAEVEKRSIRSMVSYLNGNIGAVNGFVVAKSKSFIKEKEDYKKNEWELRYEEGLIDSACNLDGKLIAFRRSVLRRFPKDCLTDDYSMTFLIRKKGYRAIVDKSARVYETLPDNLWDEIKQIKRYGKDMMLTNIKNINFLFNPEYGFFGLMTFPFRRFFPLFYPVFLAYIIVYLFFVNSLLSLAVVFLGALFLLLFDKLKMIQILAITLSYFDLFGGKRLKEGRWEIKR
jgi:cellulose synthase/poly-beta-1,6-N-acetylglucosamine synthase-like glycosyltransferase